MIYVNAMTLSGLTSRKVNQFTTRYLFIFIKKEKMYSVLVWRDNQSHILHKVIKNVFYNLLKYINVNKFRFEFLYFLLIFGASTFFFTGNFTGEEQAVAFYRSLKIQVSFTFAYLAKPKSNFFPFPQPCHHAAIIKLI